MWSLEWTLLRYDCCPSKKKEFGHRHSEEDYGKGSREKTVSSSQGQRPGTDLSLTEGANPADTLIWGLEFQEGETIPFCYLSHLVVLLCYSSPGKLVSFMNHWEEKRAVD